MKKTLLATMSIFVVGTQLGVDTFEVQALELASQLFLPVPKSVPLTPISFKVVDYLSQNQVGKPVQGIMQIPVLEQGNIKTWPLDNVAESNIPWSLVKTDDAANCGYHALKNVILLMNALQTNNKQFVEHLKSDEKFFYYLKVWVPAIGKRVVKEFGAQERVNWLQGNEIEGLIQHNSKQFLQDGLQSDDVFIMEWHQDYQLDEVVNEKAVTALKDKSKKILGCVWNDSGAHWHSFVLDRRGSGSPNIYYMNSSGNSPLDDKSDHGQIRIGKIKQLLLGDADALQQRLQEKQMKYEFRTIDLVMKYLKGESDTGFKASYSTYVGCITRLGSMKDGFSKEDLERAGFKFNNLTSKKAIIKVNKNWQDYLKKLVENAMDSSFKNADIQKSKNRVYGFWRDDKTDNIYIVDLDIDVEKGCSKAKEKYAGSILLLNDKYEITFFNPVTNIEIMFKNMLEIWANIKWSDDFKKQLSTLLSNVKDYLKLNTVVDKLIDWSPFGGKEKAFEDASKKLI